MFSGYTRLAFIYGGERYEPGAHVELPDETDQQAHEITRLLSMGVIQRTDPAGNAEELDDTFTPEGREPGETVTAKPKGRAAAKLAEKARRDGAQ